MKISTDKLCNLRQLLKYFIKLSTLHKQKSKTRIYTTNRKTIDPRRSLAA